ncbi:MAG: P27 family phage terminase small subunit [Lactobacillus sp.]|nr:P27 family phage terminase small subunit [Lactobacillus sp.]
MKALGNYKPEYSDVIEIYTDLIVQYRLYSEQYEEQGYPVSEEYTNKAGATNQRKVPILTALETIRKDILTYSDRLRLNPKADQVEIDPSKSASNALDRFLSEVKPRHGNGNRRQK